MPTPREGQSSVEQLSKRESQVLEVAKLGRTNKEIAAELGLQTSTVSTLWRRIFQKLGVANRAGAVALFCTTQIRAEADPAGARVLGATIDREDADICIYELDDELTIRWADPATYARFGLSPDEIIGVTLEEMGGLAIVKREVVEKAKLVFETGRSQTISYTYRWQNAERVVKLQLHPRPVPGGMRLLMVSRDLTQARGSQREAYLHQARLSKVLDLTEEKLAVIDERKLVAECSHGFSLLWRAMTGQPVVPARVLPPPRDPESASAIDRILAGVISEERSGLHVTPLQTQNGETVMLHAHAITTFGKRLGAVVVLKSVGTMSPIHAAVEVEEEIVPHK